MCNQRTIEPINQRTTVPSTNYQVRQAAKPSLKTTYKEACRKVSALAGVEVQHTQATKGGDGFGCSLKGIRP